jgi:hypothetical protein
MLCLRQIKKWRLYLIGFDWEKLVQGVGGEVG